MFETIFVIAYYDLFFTIVASPMVAIFAWWKWQEKRERRKAAYERLVKSGRRPPKKNYIRKK